jgi:GntR family transcriptional regulator
MVIGLSLQYNYVINIKGAVCMIDRNNPMPLYYKIKEDLVNKIKKEYRVGDAIPSQDELSEYYHVSRITIRRAVQELVAQGYLTTQQGKRTVVSNPKPSQELNTMIGWAKTMKKLGLEPETKSVNIFEADAPDFIAEIIDSGENEKVITVERIRHASGEVFCIMTNYLLKDIVKNIPQEDLKSKSLYEILANNCDVNVTRGIDLIEAKAASLHEANILNIAEGDPVLSVRRIEYDDKDRLIGVNFTVSRADKYSYTVNVGAKYNE